MLGSVTETSRRVGWTCGFVPIELIHAAGLLPVKVTGSNGRTTHADALFHTNVCQYVKGYMEELLSGALTNLTGFVAVDSCVSARRAFDICSSKTSMPLVHLLNVPNTNTFLTKGYFRTKMDALKERLETIAGMEITENDLKASIETMNTLRALLKRLSMLRTLDVPPINGSDMMEVLITSFMIEPKQAIVLVENLLQQLEGNPVNHEEPKVRLLIMGSPLDDPRFLDIVEDTQTVAVIDNLCTGTSLYWDRISLNKPVMEALSDYYIHKPACPYMFYKDKLPNHLKEICSLFKVNGVIYQEIEGCALHGGAGAIFQRYFQDLNIPFLRINRDYGLLRAGQIKIRVQAFCEMIRDDLFYD